MEYLPGTALEHTAEADKSTSAPVLAAISITGGVTLAQLKKLTGIESSTVQNWVKRGWIARTPDKLYRERQVMRIILINCLRGALQLEQIPRIMQYINGSVEDESDDIITDAALYDCFCRIVVRCEKAKNFGEPFIRQVITEETREYKPPVPDASERLSLALEAMTNAYFSGRLKERAANLIGRM